jgi:hypothetical protein
MTDKTPDIDQSIQIALEAAAAANDSADDIARLSSDTQKAAQRLDNFARGFKPVLLGVIGGAVMSIALGGLTYLRTLSEMRLTTATQTEALALFTSAVRELQENIGNIETLIADVASLKEAQEAMIARLNDSPLEIGGDDLPGGLAALLAQEHEATRAAMTAAISDLHLALTRQMADTPAQPQASPTQAPPADQGPRPRPRPTPPPPQPQPANPFSFP